MGLSVASRGKYWFWGDTGKSPRFVWIFDWRVSVFVLVWVIHARGWTFWTLVVAAVVLWVIERKGFTLQVFIRHLRRVLVGRVRPARPWWWRKKWRTDLI